jgi:YfiH family protein
MIRSTLLSAEHGFPTKNEASARALVTVNQVHGVSVVEAATAPAQADGLWTSKSGVGLGIRTADCIPLLLESKQNGRVAAVHAGWKGVIGEIPMVGVGVLESEPGAMQAALGPHIRQCCYCVGEDLAERFGVRFGSKVLLHRAGRVYLDLAYAVRAQLSEKGVTLVDDVERCTHCDTSFHSFRRGGAAAGRQVSFIVCP